MKLTDFDVVTFDRCGTLIDWEAGLLEALSPLLARANVDRDAALQTFAEFESRQQAETGAMTSRVSAPPSHPRARRRWTFISTVSRSRRQHTKRCSRLNQPCSGDKSRIMRI